MALNRVKSVPNETVSQEIKNFNTIYKDETSRLTEVTITFAFDRMTSVWYRLHQDIKQSDLCKVDIDTLDKGQFFEH